MISTANKKIYVYTCPKDMRKSINGLVVLLHEALDKNPQSGDLFLFTNRARDKIKCLPWDQNGFVLYYKRLEQGRFHYSKHIQNEQICITEPQLKALLMGLDFYLVGNYQKECYMDLF